MFNPNNSAYGRGITANLVTEQERQKFNTGGRVRYQEGDDVGGFDWRETGLSKTMDALGGVKNVIYDIPNLALNQGWKFFTGYNPGWSSRRMERGEKDLYEKMMGRDPLEREDRMTDEEVNKNLWFFDATPGWASAKKGKKVEAIDDLQDDIYKKQLVSKPEVVDEESDVIDWTPEEKQEKKGQIQLAMAERLIGGARDPLGSTKQQKNLAGMFGDIRKITDKEDLRKWKRRYDAEADAYTKKMGAVNKMGREYSDYRHQGLQPVEALSRMSDVGAKTITRVTKQKDLDKQYKGLGPGSVVYDENDGGWYIINPKGGRENVTIEDIIEADKKGVLKEWKETKVTLTEK
jgi:hypothetical protein